jgi:YgiT-type zinc finger domain-containing protein
MKYCPSCQIGRLQERSIVYLEWHGKELLIVDRMPAIICDYCGEHSYDQIAMEYLQRLLLSTPPNSPRIVPPHRQSYNVKPKIA